MLNKRDIYILLKKEIMISEDTIKDTEWKDGFIKGLKRAIKLIKSIKKQNEN